MFKDPFVSQQMTNTQKYDDCGDRDEKQRIEHYHTVSDAMQLNASGRKCIHIIYVKFYNRLSLQVDRVF